MTTGRLHLALVLLAASTGVCALQAQVAKPNEAGVAMGHLHYRVRDVEANRQFWVALGGRATRLGTTRVVKFPDVLVFLTEGASSGGSEGSVVNHVAFRVQSLATLEAQGFKVQYVRQFPGVASVVTPEGERIELFDETATNATFTPDAGRLDPVADRHNRKITVPIVAHHIHLYVPQGAERDAQQWYARVFGATPGKRWRYDAVDLPGINLNFSGAPRPTSATRGRMLDHIGFEIRHLEAFCRTLAAKGVTLDDPYSKDSNGIATAVLTDPWGTSIELTEGLNRL